MNSWFSRLLSRFLIDLRNGHRHAVLAKYYDLLRLSSLPPDEIRRYQGQRLADLLNHAATHVPFWKKYITLPVTPANARAVLADLPIMERSAIQSAPSDFVAEGTMDDRQWTKDERKHGPSNSLSSIVNRQSSIVHRPS